MCYPPVENLRIRKSVGLSHQDEPEVVVRFPVDEDVIGRELLAGWNTRPSPSHRDLGADDGCRIDVAKLVEFGSGGEEIEQPFFLACSAEMIHDADDAASWNGVKLWEIPEPVLQDVVERLVQDSDRDIGFSNQFDVRTVGDIVTELGGVVDFVVVLVVVGYCGSRVRDRYRPGNRDLSLLGCGLAAVVVFISILERDRNLAAKHGHEVSALILVDCHQMLVAVDQCALFIGLDINRLGCFGGPQLFGIDLQLALDVVDQVFVERHGRRDKQRDGEKACGQ